MEKRSQPLETQTTPRQRKLRKAFSHDLRIARIVRFCTLCEQLDAHNSLVNAYLYPDGRLENDGPIGGALTRHGQQGLKHTGDGPTPRHEQCRDA
jgi:hypothetical protein